MILNRMYPIKGLKWQCSISPTTGKHAPRIASFYNDELHTYIHMWKSYVQIVSLEHTL